MEKILEKSYQRVKNTDLQFERSLIERINWNARLIGIKGARGVGKTTMLLQYIKKNLINNDDFLYASLDNLWFSENLLSDLVDYFVKKGGKYLFLDEVHKYSNWSQELKNIYDDYPNLKIVFTGSSLLQILNARADLSRRAITYQMQGLSFREYLNMSLSLNLPIFNFEEILNNHIKLAEEITNKIKPLKYFDNYLQQGYFPFFLEEKDLYFSRLEEIINFIIEIELPQLRGVEIGYINKIKQLLLILSESMPFIPNVSKLSEKIGINRQTFTTYLYYLQEAKLTKHLYKDNIGISKLQKPEKIYFENPNYAFILANNTVNQGNIRETFFLNQLGYNNIVEYTDFGDFIVNNKYTFEIGGKNKTNKQISNIKDSYIVSDNIEFGFANKIPLWLFGFLY